MSTGPRGEAATDTDSTTAPDTSQPTARTKWFSLGVLALGLSMIVLDGTIVGVALPRICLLYTSDAADERSSVDLGGRRSIKKKNTENTASATHDQQ